MDINFFDRRWRPDWLVVDHWKTPTGWDLRRFRCGNGRAGSILFQTGRADFFEKYLEAIAHWRDLGWSVEGFDWRGQGGSGRLLDNPRIGHAPPFGVLVQDLSAYVKEWLARTPGPHILIGHSMGGHLELRLLGQHGAKVDGMVLLSPMLGLRTGLLPPFVVRMMASLAGRIGLGRRAIWGGRKAGSGHRQRNLTHSKQRFADELWWREREPMLDLGPPSWSWMRRAFASIARFKTRWFVERVTIPTLVLYAEKDRLVPASAIRKICGRLPNARLRSHPTAAHELLREDDEAREWANEEIDRFLMAFSA